MRVGSEHSVRIHREGPRRPSPVLYALGLGFVVAYVVRWRSDPLHAIPTVGGPSLPILSLISVYNFIFRGHELIMEGYQKYYGSAFKVASLDGWNVVVSGPKLVDELRKRPDDELSFLEATEEFLQFTHTLGRQSLDDSFHIDIIRDKLMRTLPVVLPDVIDELSYAVPDYIPTAGEEWTTVHAMTTMQKIVARISNRVFVGIPLCRDKSYLKLAIDFTTDVVKDVPSSLSSPNSSARECVKKQRRCSPRPRHEERHSDRPVSAASSRRAPGEDGRVGDGWEDKPNDMLQWVMEAAIPRRASDENIAERILLTNFAAIHTRPWCSITHALYSLAAYPEYMQPLRDEVEAVVAAEGWSKAAMGKMWKLDSFLREAQRCHGIGIRRHALRRHLPPHGHPLLRRLLGHAPRRALYPDPDTFDPFRYANMRGADGEGTKHQFVNTSLDYIAFGHGKHAWYVPSVALRPGAVLRASELKSMLAFIVANYDLKLPGDGKRPRNVHFGLLLKRQTVSA
ncbi:cytochrome P450 [Epithele typhae]|uniref:cytochrome P450 n=1 Tax=Epithele typhae TaxID=378194 RepID=UPI0020075DA3|nr:cytochrome P450 [Epithele typhae]KAH9921475.1 cytochrome P450 [Epithele typhae]